MRASSKQAGFTLIELVIVLVITAILVAMAAPSFTQAIHNNRVETSANGLQVGLNTARSEAIRLGQDVSICAGNPATPACGVNWAQGWLVFTGVAFNAANIVKVGTGDVVLTTVVGTAPAQISFTSRGIVDTNVTVLSTGTLIVNALGCTTGKDKQLTLTVSTVGRVVTTSGTCP